MNPSALGILAGAALALVYFAASALFSSRVVPRFQAVSVPLALMGFVGRLTLAAIILYGLTGIKGIHFQTTLITFAVSFTVCTIWKASRVYREDRTLIKSTSKK